MPEVKDQKHLKQLPAVLKTVAGIMIISAAIEILFTAVSRAIGTSTQNLNIIPYAIDIFLAVNLLKGKVWARTWILVRCFLGAVVFGAISVASGNIFSLVVQLAYVTVIVVLLFGAGSRKKAVISGIVYGLILAVYIVVATLGFSFVAAHKNPSFTSEKHGLFISKPSKSWMIIPENEPDFMSLGIPGQVVEVTNIADEVIVAILVSQAQSEDIEASGRVLADSLAQQPQNVITSQKKTLFNNMDAYEITYSSKTGFLDATGRFIIIIANSRLYGIVVVATDTALRKWSDDIEAILASVEVSQPEVSQAEISQ